MGALAGVFGGAAGGALAFRYRQQLQSYRLAIAGRSHRDPLPFHQRAGQICAQHARQSVADAAALKARLATPAFGPMKVWDLFEKLAQCVDVTDASLYCASQFLHVQQMLAAMEREAVDDEDLLMAAILHDLGKVYLLKGEPPENILCRAGRLTEGQEGIGLENLAYQLGHGELVYLRVKDYVPEHVAWTLRYHNIDLADAAPYMNARDRQFTEKYLLAFRRYDGQFKSAYQVPQVNMDKYHALVDRYFPQPIVF